VKTHLPHQPSVVLFDVYRTLLVLDDDQTDVVLLERLVRWFSYRGLTVTADHFLELRNALTTEHLERARVSRGTEFPDVDVVEILVELILHLSCGRYPRAHELAAELALILRDATTTSLTLVPGVAEVLGSLSGRTRLGIVSNTQRAYTIHELERFDLLGHFDALVFSSDVGACKPDPRPFRRCLAALGDPSEAVYVGDNPFDDVVGAHAAGLSALLLTWPNERTPALGSAADDAPEATLDVTDIIRLPALLGFD